MSEKPPLRLGVLLSGTGRTLDNFFEKIDAGVLPAQIVLVLSSHEGARGLDKARQRGIATALVDFRKVHEPEFSPRIAQALRDAKVELVAMAGFIRHWAIPVDFQGRVVNIHPALLPEFGGRGMYGSRVHEAVSRSGKRETGCTVHFVDEQYDHGKTILQRRIEIEPGEDPHRIAEMVFAQECIAYPEAIRALHRDWPR